MAFDSLVSNASPSLFVFAQLSLPSGYADYRHTVTRMSGIISDIGFSNGWREALPDIDNRTYDFSTTMYVYDRFLTFEVDPAVRSVARITVSEDYVRDEQIRSDIGHTGIKVSVALRDEPFRLIQDHLDQPTDDDGDAFTAEHFRRLALRIPTGPFEFPPTRGNSDPWGGGENPLGPLRCIRKFEIDRIEVTVMSRQRQTAVPVAGPLFDRYRAWLGSTLALRSE